MLSKILVKDLPRNIKRITVFFPVTGHSFLPADRIFGRLEKKFRRMECITSPFDYINAFNEVATVFQLGKDFFCYNWKASCTEVLKLTSSWHFPFSKSKRFIISRSKTNNALVRGEMFYRSDLMMPRPINKPGHNISSMEPLVLPVGIKVNKDKLSSIAKLLTKHYSKDWSKNEELKYYQQVISSINEDTGNVLEHEEENDEPMEEINVKV